MWPIPYRDRPFFCRKRWQTYWRSITVPSSLESKQQKYSHKVEGVIQWVNQGGTATRIET